jgi:hypothetical protein
MTGPQPHASAYDSEHDQDAPGYHAVARLQPRRLPGPPVSFEQEIADAVRDEQRVAVKALIALLIVALVIGARLLFF